MAPQEAAQLVRALEDLSSQGYTVVTWNGLGFDFDVLAEESGLEAECARIAVGHVDMLFHVLCSLGHLVSLQKAAEGMRISGKRSGLSGAEAPAMWASGRYEEVIEYCVQDVRIALQLADSCERRGKLAWVTQRGGVRGMPLPAGWLSVEQARALPLPDTSSMTDPHARDRFLHWLPKEGAR